MSPHVLKTQMRMRNSFPRGLINEYTYQNAVQFKIKSMRSLRLSSFIVAGDIISKTRILLRMWLKWCYSHCDSSTKKNVIWRITIIMNTFTVQNPQHWVIWETRMIQSGLPGSITIVIVIEAQLQLQLHNCNWGWCL